MNEIKVVGKYTMQWKPPQVMDGDRVVRLSPKQFRVLELLVRAGGKTVPKRTFLNKIWSGGPVEEANLSQAIFIIRRALGRLPSGADYIETAPRLGYRLSAEAMDPHHSTSRVASARGTLYDEYQFRMLVESIEEYAIYMLDPAGRVLTWNRGAERNKGYRSEEVLGQHYSLFFVPEDIKDQVPDRELSMARTTGRCSGEGWRMRKNGERFWASFVLSAMRGADGRLIGFAKVVTDLSDKKRRDDSLLRMEAIVRRERDRLHAAAESSMDALFICEAVRGQEGEIEDFVFTYLNSNVEKMVSIPRDVLLLGRMSDLLPVNLSQALFHAYKQVVQTGAPCVMELQVHSDNIASEWIRVRAVRLDDGIVVTMSDLTEQKRFQKG